jgi:hypothetical protein
MNLGVIEHWRAIYSKLKLDFPKISLTGSEKKN